MRKSPKRLRLPKRPTHLRLRERPVYLRLTDEQVESIREPVQGHAAARLWRRIARGRGTRLRLTEEQVRSAMDPAQSYTLEKLIALISGWVPREGIPQIEVWDELAEGKMGERFSVELARGLLLLAHLADRETVGANELARDLHIGAGPTNLYLETLLMSGLVAHDPETQRYRLAE